MTTQFSDKTRKFKDKVKGNIMIPGDAGYDNARQIWNAMIDRRPAVIVQCVGGDDVAQAIGFARETGLDISVRGGGHNIAGYSVCERAKG